MKTHWIDRWIDGAAGACSGFVFFLLLPITSMPALVKLVGSDVVAAPAGALLPLLLIAWTIPYLFRSGSLSRNTLLLTFMTVAFIATLLSLVFTAWI